MQTWAEIERAALEERVRKLRNVTHAAKSLGISVRALQRKMRRWGWPAAAPGQSVILPELNGSALASHNTADGASPSQGG